MTMLHALHRITAGLASAGVLGRRKPHMSLLRHQLPWPALSRGRAKASRNNRGMPRHDGQKPGWQLCRWALVNNPVAEQLNILRPMSWSKRKQFKVAFEQLSKNQKAGWHGS